MDIEIPEALKRPINEEDDNGSKLMRSSLVDQLDHETLNKLYYIHLFPYHSFYRWLNYGMKATKNFTHREFSFTLENDVYLRYQSFENESQLKDRILRTLPKKIDIGAIYSAKPKDKKMINTNNFIPLSKELVLDIDLTDYDMVRTCCSGADICLKCWKFISLAMKILHGTLTVDFGFQNILWVYSGRRGVHAWVCDERARNLNNESRKALMNYLDIYRASPNSNRQVNLGLNLFPSLANIQPMIQHAFEDIIINDQQLFNDKNKAETIAKCLPEQHMVLDLLEEWHNKPNQRYQVLKHLVESKAKNNKIKKQAIQLQTFLRDIQFQTVYPKLDTNVTININHLLKAPFCIHPSTRKVCVPISLDEFDTFNPLTVPTDYQLHCEMSNYQGPEVKSDLFKTSLLKYVVTFNEFVDQVVKANSKEDTLDF